MLKPIAMLSCWIALAAMFVPAYAVANTVDTTATLEANKRLAMRYYDAARSGQYDVIDQIFAEHYVRHNQSEPESKAPPQGELARRLHRHMPDMRSRIDVMLAEGDLVAVHWWVQGHPGEMSIKIMRLLTGRAGPVTHAGVNIFRIKNGRIIENWNVRDDLALWTQLGLFRMYGLAGFLAGVLLTVIASRLRRRRSASRAGTRSPII
jgi:predicted SnoaL-like aldol condensation-catalyzing enzyme